MRVCGKCQQSLRRIANRGEPAELTLGNNDLWHIYGWPSDGISHCGLAYRSAVSTTRHRRFDLPADAAEWLASLGQDT